METLSKSIELTHLKCYNDIKVIIIARKEVIIIVVIIHLNYNRGE